MELYQLQYFIEVARNRNFNRGQKETLMTPAGETLFEKAQELLTMADSVKQSVAEVSELRAGRLAMAFISSVGAHWLPGILREFRNSFPCLNLITHEETSLGVAALVEEATAELGFLELPTNNLLFEVKEIWNEPFYAVLPADHALANKKNIGLQQLDKDPFIVKRGESQQQTIEACRTAGFEPRIACECTEQETKIALVQAGLGVLLLSQLDACMLREGVVAVPIREPKLLREVGLIQRRGKELSAAAQAFIEFVKKRPFPAPYETTAIRGADLAVSGAPRPEADQMDHAAPQGLLTPQKFLDRSALVFPNKIAVKFNDQTYTYAELSRRVNRLASALRKAGLESGDRVAFICSNIPPMLEAHYGVALAGGVLVPLNVRFTAGEIAYILNHSGAKFLFADSEFGSAVRPILGNLETLKKVVDILEGRGAKPLGEMDYEQFLATGRPKGVMIIHRGAYLNAIGQVIEGGASAAVKYLWTLPMFHCNGWCYTWAITAVGATHICLRKFDPAKVWQLIESEGVTHLSGSPNMFTVLLNHPDRPKSFKQPLTFGIGGSQPSPGLIARS